MLIILLPGVLYMFDKLNNTLSDPQVGSANCLYFLKLVGIFRFFNRYESFNTEFRYGYKDGRPDKRTSQVHDRD